MSKPVVLEIRGLCIRDTRGRSILDDVEMTLRAGEVTALVGETGSGKTTVLNSVLGLLPPGLEVSAGEVWFESGDRVNFLSLSESEMRQFLGLQIGYVPQDVRSGLNPLMTARAAVVEAAGRAGREASERANAALRRAGLADDFVRIDADRRPGKLSGGQCQRVLFAQAIVNQPRLLLLDEPTASLDPPTRREVRATVRSLARDDCAICLVTHDLASLAGLADTIGVLYLGRVVESGPAEQVLRAPQHPYTRALLACVPRIDERARLRPITGDPSSPLDEVSGCRFHPRCEFRVDRCLLEEPKLREVGIAGKVACHVVGLDQ